MAKLIKDLPLKEQKAVILKNLKIIGYLPYDGWKRLSEIEKELKN